MPLKGHHTQEYLAGYRNGTSDIQFNRGAVDGWNKIPTASKNPDYLDEYSQGQGLRDGDRGTRRISMLSHREGKRRGSMKKLFLA